MEIKMSIRLHTETDCTVRVHRCICFVEINKNNCNKTIWQNSQMLLHANLGKFKTIKGSNYCLWIYCSIHVIWIIVSIIHSNKQQKFHALWMTLGTLKLNIALCGSTTSSRFFCVWGFGSNNDCQNIRKLRQSFADFHYVPQPVPSWQLHFVFLSLPPP